MYEIYTNYEGCYPTDLEETFETIEEVEKWCETFESGATCEESYIVKKNGEVVMMG